MVFFFQHPYRDLGAAPVVDGGAAQTEGCAEDRPEKSRRWFIPEVRLVPATFTVSAAAIEEVARRRASVDKGVGTSVDKGAGTGVDKGVGAGADSASAASTGAASTSADNASAASSSAASAGGTRVDALEEQNVNAPAQTHGDVARVYLHVAGVHDHHLVELNRMVREGDQWRGTVDIPEDAYCSVLIAAVPEAFVAEYENPETFDSRRRFMNLLRYAIPASCVEVSGNAQVEPARFPRETLRIAMSHAPARPGWEVAAPERRRMEASRTEQWEQTPFGWSSHLPSHSDDGHRAGLILLDGQQWVRTPLLAALDRLHREGLIPCMSVYAIDTSRDRVVALSSNAATYHALEQLITTGAWGSKDGTRGERHHLVIAGQSLGGLTALEFGLAHPEHITGVIANSGSFWWPDRHGAPGGKVARDLRSDVPHDHRSDVPHDHRSDVPHDHHPGAPHDHHSDARYDHHSDACQNTPHPDPGQRTAPAALRTRGQLADGIYLSVGTAEGGPANAPTSMVQHTGEVFDALTERAQCSAALDIASAAHEMAAWEGALTRGLVWLFRGHAV